MKIPKVIHYCWFGCNPMPDKVLACVSSWKKYCPDYEIIRWDESNYDVNQIPYTADAYKMGKWAFVSDYARLDVVYRYGGIYLDTDVELVRNLDELLEESVFLAMERHNCQIATGLGFGAEPKNLVIGELMRIYDTMPFILPEGKLNLTACPQLTTPFFVQRGYCKEDRTQRLGDILILSSEYFCPMDFRTGNIYQTEHTLGIHWYEASWFDKGDKDIHVMEMKIRKHLPSSVSRIVCFVYRKTYRLFEYTREGILLKKMREKLRK